MMNDPLKEMLEDGLEFLSTLEEKRFCQPCPTVYGASIGKHYRHIIDHVDSLLVGITTGVIDYDRRGRDSKTECDLNVAKERTVRLLQQWRTREKVDLGRPAEVRSKTSSRTEAAMTVTSSLERELMYVVIHGVHHYALIGVICKTAGLKLPSGFGLAPSTIAHEEACSQETRLTSS